ncbi:MAG: DsbA family protein [Sphingomonadales bacterium]|nr:DsbA family protein [Sphingomonadales bacterium]MDE2170909.1 DsbA family protein [Sphingomonadales bacterium]
MRLPLILMAMLASLALFAPPVLAAPATWPQIADEPAAPRLAPAGFDVTIIVFSDYRCPYCLRLHATLQQAAAHDRKLRIVYRDWPIFGEASAHAAQLAIASQYQGKYEAFNDAIFRLAGQLDDKSLRQAAQSVGIDWARLQRDLAAHDEEIGRLMARSNVAARALGFEGTPGLLVGTQRAFGAPSLDQLETMIREERQKGRSAGKA